MLEVEIVKARRDFVVEVALALAPGERRAIFGASGAGKSTVLSCIAGFESPDRGRIGFAGRRFFPPPMPLHERRLGYLAQRDLLFPHLSVAQNVCFGLRQPDETSRLWLGELKERLELTPIWRARANHISGGQARRVAMARMLAPRPSLVLLDEPFAGMDWATVSDLLQALMQWHRRLNFSLLAVDHRSAILQRLCPQALVMEQGRIVQRGAWEDLAAAPATPLLARLLASADLTPDPESAPAR